VVLSHEQTIPTERPPLVGEVSAKFRWLCLPKFLISLSQSNLIYPHGLQFFLSQSYWCRNSAEYLPSEVLVNFIIDLLAVSAFFSTSPDFRPCQPPDFCSYHKLHYITQYIPPSLRLHIEHPPFKWTSQKCHDAPLMEDISFDTCR
jgi:hypothetical protein